MKMMKYQKITEKTIGASMRVQGRLENEFQVVMYQRALEIELLESDLKFKREFSLPVY